MIGYINSVRDREYKLCTPEIFESLVNSPMVTTHIEECRKGNAASKSLLPAFLFQGYDPNVLLGKKGSRLAKALKPTGFFIMDFDHVSKAKPLSPNPSPRDGERGVVTPGKLYDRFLQRLPSLGLDLKRDVALAHITPSGDGLRLVLVTPKGMDIEAAQEWVAKIMEIECDAVVKDLSRLSFCPMASDILYVNKQLLFSPTPALPDREGVPNTPAGNPHDQQDIPKALPLSGGDGGGLFPDCYNGIPYKRIVEELILLHGGEPQVGNRENTIFRLASDLAKITDRSAPWLESLIPTFGLPESEWRNTITQVCKKPMETGMSRKLQEAIRRCWQGGSSSLLVASEMADALPPEMPEQLPALVELATSKVMPHLKPAVATMIFPALATYVSDCLFKFADNTDLELGLMGCLVAKQSVGKGCITQPIKMIMKRIVAQDDINRERERQWAQKQNNKKANERGEARPVLPIRYLDSDTTQAAFLARLDAAERGDNERKNLCTFTQVDEIEELYNFCQQGGKTNVRQRIKKAWDRGRIGAERFTANAANYKSVLRWNFCASTTVDGAKMFFDKCLTDGTTSRIDFCTIIPPLQRIKFRYGTYDKEFADRMAVYVDRLEQFKCEKTESGEIIPQVFERILELEQAIDEYIDDVADAEPDNTFENYARRAKVMEIKKLIILYIANGCEWEDALEPFTWWTFKYGMWCKMNLFYEKATEKFSEERIVDRGHKSPLKQMARNFSLGDFAAACQKMGLKTDPGMILRKYKNRDLITVEKDGTYTINDRFCRKNFIK